MQNPLTLAKQNLENSAKAAEDEFLLNVSAQLARESLQQSLAAMAGEQAKENDASHDLVALYRQVQPVIKTDINSEVLTTLAEEDFMESEEREFRPEEVKEYLAAAETVYATVKEQLKKEEE